MDITAMGMAHKNKLSAVFIALICSNVVFAGDWKFDPSIRQNEAGGSVIYIAYRRRRKDERLFTEFD